MSHSQSLMGDHPDDSSSLSLLHETDREVVVHGGRVKYIHNVDKDDHTNRIVTAQYTWWNFLPKNIFMQFCNGANLYFLLIGILQCIPAITTSKGIPTMYVPLTFVICVGAIRAAIEDRARHVADSERNHTKFWRLASSLDYGTHASSMLLQKEDIDRGIEPYNDIDWVNHTERVKTLDKVALLPGEGTGCLPAPIERKSNPWYKSLLSTSSRKPVEYTDEELHAIARRRAVLNNNEHSVVVNSGDLKVGSIVKIYKNQMIPCDMIILGSSESRGHCFIDKANLNGETTLEVVGSPPVLRNYITETGEKLYNVIFHLVYEAPSSNFERFRGTMRVIDLEHPENTQELSITSKQVLLRETILRNSEWIYGLTVYTGDDTKIRKSVTDTDKAPTKYTTISKYMNRFIITMFILQFVLCVGAGIYNGIWRYHFGKKHVYLRLEDDDGLDIFLSAIAATFSWMILLSTIVPISLLVSAEMCKFAFSFFVEWDVSLFSSSLNKPATCNTSAVHEDLGMIDYVFSDKTGTLTQNKMEFRFGFIANHNTHPYLHDYTNSNTTTTTTTTTTSSSHDNGVQHSGRVHNDNPTNTNTDSIVYTDKFVSFGNIETDIARAVREKMALSTQAAATSTSSTFHEQNNIYYPSSDVNAYTNLPPRWTKLLCKELKAIRVASAPPSKEELKKIPYTLAKQRARVRQLRGGWVGSGVFSRCWHQSQGRYYNAYVHAKKQFRKYKQKGEYTKYLIQHAEARTSAYIPMKLNSPSNSEAVDGTGHMGGVSMMEDHSFILDSHIPHLPGISTGATGTTGGGEETSINTVPHSMYYGAHDDNRDTMRMLSGGNGSGSPSLLPSHIHSTGDEEYDEDEYGIHDTTIENENELEISPSSVTLDLLMKTPDSTSMKNLQTRPSNTTTTSSNSTSTSSNAPASNVDTNEVKSLKKRLDKELSVPATHLGAFGVDERVNLLHTLWKHNWNTHSRAISQEDLSERLSILNYMRTMALSSTVKPYRKTDGQLDWQFESAEELAMVRFAAACGFVREAHPSGHGTILYIREYLTSDLVEEQSVIHIECYNNIGVLGFSSKRARVTVLWQRQLYATLENVNGYTMSDIIYDPNELHTDISSVYSTYIQDYDIERKMVNEQPDIVHVGRIHVLTKGQDAVLLPLLCPNDSTSQVMYIDPHHPLQAELRNMSSNGLRVLVSGHNIHDSTWWETFNSAYNALNLLDDAQIITDIYRNHTHTSPKTLRSLRTSNASTTSTSSNTHSQTSNGNDNGNGANNTNNGLGLMVDVPANSGTGMLSPTIMSDTSSVCSSQCLDPVTQTKLYDNPYLNKLLHTMFLRPTTGEYVTVGKLRHELYEVIEKEAKLQLLGCIAMEDKLQHLVPECIRDLDRAGIRVWMITGDKLETARNIGLACNLIDADMVLTMEQVANVTNQKDTHLPLAVRAVKGTRLIEITGDWYGVWNHDIHVFDTIYTLLTEKTGVLTLAYLQECLANLGIVLSYVQLYYILSADIPKEEMLRSDQVTGDIVVTKDQFSVALEILADTYSKADAIFIDIEQGLRIYKQYEGQNAALSLLVNREAFLTIFPLNAPSASSTNGANGGMTPSPTSPRSMGGGNNTCANAAAHGNVSASTSITNVRNMTSPIIPLPSVTATATTTSTTSTSTGMPGMASPVPSTGFQTSGTTLSDTPDLSTIFNRRFFALATVCKSVVFARAEPAMKRRMVTSIQSIFPTAVTLAIGDGANDTEMLSNASIGVGIAGVEGTAASNIADYAIGSFRMLHTLLFVHGTKAYGCISKLVVLMFYKASLIAWTSFFFGFDSNFSGQQWFNDALYQLYNIIYTAWPVLIVGSLDQPLPAAVLENSPAVYRNLKGSYFNASVFAKWMIKSFFHSMYIYLVPRMVQLLDDNYVLAGSHVGKTYDFWYTSTLQLGILSVLPNLMALFLMESLTIFHWVAVYGSSVLFYIVLILLTISPKLNPDVYGFVQVYFTDITFLLQFVILLSIPILIDVTVNSIYNMWAPTLTLVLRERIYARSLQYEALAKQAGEDVYADATKPPTSNTTNNTGKETTNTRKSKHKDTYREPLLSPNEDKSEQSMHSTYGAISSSSSNDNNVAITVSSSNTVASPSASMTHRIGATTTSSSNTNNLPEVPCWSVQVLGPDPDPSALESAELFGEAAGWGVRATSCESAYVNNLPEDRFHMFTQQAKDILTTSTYNSLEYIPNYDLEKYAEWKDTVTRMTAGQVLRALISVHNNNSENTFHSVANQKYTVPEKFSTANDVQKSSTSTNTANNDATSTVTVAK